MSAGVDGRVASEQAEVRWRKRIGVAFVAVPFAMFSIFAMGEATALEPGWSAHLVQVAGVVVLAAGGWRWPRVGGLLLVAGGVVFTLAGCCSPGTGASYG